MNTNIDPGMFLGFTADEMSEMFNDESYVTFFLDTTIATINNIKDGGTVDLECNAVIFEGRMMRDVVHVEIKHVCTISDCSGVRRILNDAYVMGCRFRDKNWGLDRLLIVTFDTSDSPLRIRVRVSKPAGNKRFNKLAESHQIKF